MKRTSNTLYDVLPIYKLYAEGCLTHIMGPTLVMMAGLPGSGKTTLAYGLQRELGWQVIDKDKYREALMQQGVDPERASRVAYDLSFAQARTLLIMYRMSAILDSAALDRFIIDEVTEIVRGSEDARLKVILCVAERYQRDERLRKRPYQPTRIRVNPDTISDYLRYFDHLPTDKLILFTSIPPLECVARARSYIELKDPL